MAKLILVRGLPGSGKSTYAKKLAYEHDMVHFESDMFFVDSNGSYNYRRDLINYAHQWCAGSVALNLSKGLDVVVSNTFCAEWEMDNYFNLASILNAELLIIEMRTQYGSIHNVPDEAVQRMKDRWFELSDEHHVTVIE